MSDQQVIREFLVALGFKTDEAGLKKFTNGIENATKNVGKLVFAIEGAAIAVTAQVTKFATGMEQMYFAAERTGATATALKAAGYAAQNLGASAEQAKSAFEGVARFMRDTPGGEGLIQSLGVATRDANGNLIETGEIITNLGHKFAGMKWFEAKPYASMFGIDDQMLRAIQSGDFQKFADEYRKLADKTNLEKAAQDSHEYMKSIRELTTVFDLFGIKVDAVLLKKIGPDLEDFKQWFVDNEPLITEKIGSIAEALMDVAIAIPKMLLAPFDSTFQKSYGDYTSGILDSITDPIKGLVSKATNGQTWEEWLNRTKNLFSDGKAPRGIRNNNPGNLNYAGQSGATKESGPGGRFAVFASAEEGLEALSKQLHRWANNGVDSIEKIISKYAPAIENDTKAYMQTIAKRMGVSTIDHLDLNDPTTMAKMMNNIIHYENGANPYSAAMVHAAASNGIKGGGGVNLTQNNHITVNGAHDAPATSRAVEDTQSRLNQQMTRNLQTAVQ
ncbi:MAG: hypothetical protein ACXV7F_09715 [Methylomonas sp.]